MCVLGIALLGPRVAEVHARAQPITSTARILYSGLPQVFKKPIGRWSFPGAFYDEAQDKASLISSGHTLLCIWKSDCQGVDRVGSWTFDELAGGPGKNRLARVVGS